MLTGYIRGQELRISTPELAADSIKYLEAEFHFAGRDWDGYTKTAYFINGTSKFALVLADDCITADMGLNLTAGEWEVKLSGVKGGSRITTTTEHIYVREFGSTDGTLPDVTATQAEQILAKIGDLANLTTEDKTNLVAAINEAAKSGGGSGGGGKDGTGIASITYKGEDEAGGNVYTVLLTDGTSYDITAPKGAKGDKGDKGDTGSPGAKGDKGDTGSPGADGVTPTIGDNGNWYIGSTDTGKPSRGAAGTQGAKGDKGDPGATGATPNIQIGEVTTLNAGADATASITGTTENPLLNLGIPKGADGSGGSGGGEMWETIKVLTLEDAANTVTINQDSSGNAIALAKVRVLIEGSATSAQDLFLNGARYIRASVVGTAASVGALAAEPFCGKMYCFAVSNNIANYAAVPPSANVFSAEITITEIKLIVNNSGTFSAGTKFTVQGVRA